MLTLGLPGPSRRIVVPAPEPLLPPMPPEPAEAPPDPAPERERERRERLPDKVPA